jgi:hypothetical protein
MIYLKNFLKPNCFCANATGISLVHLVATMMSLFIIQYLDKHAILNKNGNGGGNTGGEFFPNDEEPF